MTDRTRALDRLRCWLRGKAHRLRYRERWNGHCWGYDGACMDCGWDRHDEVAAFKAGMRQYAVDLVRQLEEQDTEIERLRALVPPSESSHDL